MSLAADVVLGAATAGDLLAGGGAGSFECESFAFGRRLTFPVFVARGAVVAVAVVGALTFVEAVVVPMGPMGPVAPVGPVGPVDPVVPVDAVAVVLVV
jgi:hypothetical protein